MQRQKPPHVALMEMCKEIAGDAVWALGMGVSESGDRQWEVYCESKEAAEMLPSEYGGNQIHIIIATRPTPKDILEAKRQTKRS